MSAQMNLEQVFMFAADHRWQWEEWCDRSGVERTRIAEVKQLVVDAYLQARGRSAEVREAGALLLDRAYGNVAVERARAAGVRVGTPVEKAGVFPLEWQDEPFYSGLSGNSFAKVLVRDRPEWEAAARRGQVEKLLALQAWCRGQGIPLLVEVVIMRQHEPEQTFEEIGRPRLLASVIRAAYAAGLQPALWKIEGAGSFEGAALVDAAIRERPGSRQIILGKGADAAVIAKWFGMAAQLPSAVGFAIGRSVFWGPGTAYLLGEARAEDASAEMAARYLGFVREWQRAAAPAS